MINMIRSDLFRLGKARLWIILIVLFAIVFITPGLYTLQFPVEYSGNPRYEELSEYREMRAAQMGVEDVYDLTTEQLRQISFELDWFCPDKIAIGGNYFMIFVAAILYIVLITSTDLSTHAVKNTLSAPFSRTMYFFAKEITVVLLTVISTFVLNIYVWAVNLLINGPAHSMEFGEVLFDSFKQIIPLMFLISIFHFPAFLIKKSLPYTIFAYALMMFGPNLIINIALLAGINMRFVMYFPSFMFGTVMYPETEGFAHYMIISSILYVTVILVTNLTGYLTFKKQEIR